MAKKRSEVLISSLLFLIVSLLPPPATAFSLSMSLSKTIYNIPNSGWTSPSWNWGYATGTGHDCAAICRSQYSSRQDREAIVQSLCNSLSCNAQDRQPQNFEEVKLTLALAWQRGRWDGSDGGRGGYGEILAAMADAKRYETKDEGENTRRFVKDIGKKFKLLNPTPNQISDMKQALDMLESDSDAARRLSSGLVLQAMGFVEKGL